MGASQCAHSSSPLAYVSTTMSSDPLDPAALISRLPRLLPPSKSLKSPQDAITALVHAAMSALEFRLIGIQESAAAQDLVGNVLPSEWNQTGPGHYTLVYRHEQSSLSFVIHVSKLGSRTMINAIASEVRKLYYGTSLHVLKRSLERQSCIHGYIYRRLHIAIFLPS
jgi:hypothetical protein